MVESILLHLNANSSNNYRILFFSLFDSYLIQI